MRRKLCWNFGISSTEANVRAGHNLQDVKQNRPTAITKKTVLAITQAFRPVDVCSAPGKSSKPMPVRAMNAAPLKTIQRAGCDVRNKLLELARTAKKGPRARMKNHQAIKHGSKPGATCENVRSSNNPAG
jgi:hypothetical protein